MLNQQVISYPGSKKRFYPHMVEYFPTDVKVLVEPFFGGGSVTLCMLEDPRFSKLERVIAGDLYTEIWAMWSGIKKNPEAVYEIAEKMFKTWCPHQEQLRSTGFICDISQPYLPGGSMEKFEDDSSLSEQDKAELREKLELHNLVMEEGDRFWKWSQSVETTSNMTLEERAARMLLVNRLSFSGMGDSGSMSKYKLGDFRIDSLDVIFEASKLLQKVDIYNTKYEDTMEKSKVYDDKDVFIFLDPPYANQESSGLYGKGGSTHKGFDHQAFGDYTRQFKCKWFVTYDDSVVVRKIFANVPGKQMCYTKAFSIPGGYTMSMRNSEDALKGEELFIANYDLDMCGNIGLEDF